MPLTLCSALNTHSWRIPSTGREGVFPHHSRSLFHHLQMLFSNTDHDSALARLAGFQIPHISPWELNSGLSFPIRTKVIEYHLATDLCATIGILERLLYVLVSLLYTTTYSESGRQRVVLGAHGINVTTHLCVSGRLLRHLDQSFYSPEVVTDASPACAQCHQDFVSSVMPPTPSQEQKHS